MYKNIPKDIEDEPLAEMKKAIYNSILIGTIDIKTICIMEDKEIVVVCEPPHAVCLSVI